MTRNYCITERNSRRLIALSFTFRCTVQLWLILPVCMVWSKGQAQYFFPYLFAQDDFVEKITFSIVLYHFCIKLDVYAGEGNGTSLQYFLPGKSHGRRSLVGCSPWGRKELDTTERLYFHFSLSCIGEGSGNPLQSSCLEKPKDGGAWWAAVCGVAKNWTRLEQLSSSSSSSRCICTLGCVFELFILVCLYIFLLIPYDLIYVDILIFIVRVSSSSLLF